MLSLHKFVTFLIQCYKKENTWFRCLWLQLFWLEKSYPGEHFELVCFVCTSLQRSLINTYNWPTEQLVVLVSNKGQ